MESITLQVGGSIISSGDALGQVQFAASAESDGGASRYIVGRIYGEAEGAFNASSNPASIVFATSAADNLPASGKIKISHEGHILPLEDDTYDLGEPNNRFRNLYLASGIAATGTFDTIIFNTGIGDIDQVAGQTNWNYEAGTLEIGLTDDLKIQVGQTVLFRVKNSTGSTLSKGQAVYASGVLGGGQIIQAAPFAADESVDEVRFIGLMTDDLANGEDGYVNHFGHIKNVDLRTSNTTLNPNGETWAIGDILFVDDGTAGGLTKVPPQDDIYVALVLADGQNGELFVRITDPGHITDLHDVNMSGLVDNNLMVWNSGADYWEPTTSMTFDGTTLHLDTDGITAKFGRDNAQTNGGKVRIYVDDADTAGSVQAIKAFNAKTTGYNYGINATANGSGATRNVGLYGWAAQATTNWGLWVDAGDAIFDENVGIGTSAPAYDLHVNGSGYVVNDFNIGGSSNIGGDVIVGGNVTIQGTTVTANVSSMEIEDPIFTLGQASGTIVTDTNLDRGLALVLSTGTTAFMGWDTSEGEFSLLSSGVATNDSGNYAPGTYGNLHIAGLTASTANFSSTIDAANLGAGEDNSVVILDSDGKLRTDEIDSRVWGTSLVDGAGSANHVAFWSGANTLSYDNGQLYWDSTNNRLGIGTASPSYNLDLDQSANTNHTINISNTNTGTGSSAGFRAESDSTLSYMISHADARTVDRYGFALGGWTEIISQYSSGIMIGTDASDVPIVFGNNNTERMRIAAGGNVGIGTTSPSFPLVVNGRTQVVDDILDVSDNGRLLIGGAGENSNAVSVRNSSNTPIFTVDTVNDDIEVNGDIYATGNVGIGTASPSTQLDVIGSGNFTGDVSISGHLSAATKSFLINHPTREGHKLQYGSLESPYHGVRLTGRAKVDNGWCVVKLPEYIRELVHDNEDVNIQLTNYNHSKTLYVSEVNVTHNEFTVKTDSWFSRSGLEFYWTFTAIRKDVKELQVEF